MASTASSCLRLKNQIMLVKRAHLINGRSAPGPPLFSFGFLDVISSGASHFPSQRQNNKRRWRKASRDLSPLRRSLLFPTGPKKEEKTKIPQFHLFPGTIGNGWLVMQHLLTLTKPPTRRTAWLERGGGLPFAIQKTIHDQQDGK